MKKAWPAWMMAVAILIFAAGRNLPLSSKAQSHERSDRKISLALRPQNSFTLLGKIWVVGAADGYGGISRHQPPSVFHESGFEIVNVVQESSGASFLMTARDKSTGEAETTTVLMPFVTSRVKWVPTTAGEINDFIKEKHGGYHPLEK